MTGLLILNVILSTGIIAVIVGVLVRAIDADRIAGAARSARAGSPARAARGSQALVSLAAGD